MPRLIAAIVFAFGILGLFALDRDPKSRTSAALWIPTLWLLINGSRPVSFWLQMASVAESPNAILDGSPFDAFVFAVLLAAGLVVMVSRGAQIKTLLQANFPIVVFFLYCGVSVLWSDYPFVGFKRWVKVVGDLVMVMIVLTELDPCAAIKRLLKRTGFLLLPISILLIKYYPELGRGYSPWEGTLFNIGVGTNKNLLGMISLILGLGALWRFLQIYRSEKGFSKRKQQLIAQGVLVGMAMWLLWVSNSMTSLSCFALVGTLIVVTSFSQLARRRGVIHVLALLILGTACSVLFLDTGAGIVQSMGRDPTLTGRTAIWHLVLSLAGNPLFGTGFESFWLGIRLEKVWDIYFFHLNEAHNGYLEVFLNLGWLGIMMLGGIIVAGYKDIVSSFRQDPDGAQLRLAFLVTAMVYSLTEAGFRMMSPVWIFFLWAVVVIPKARVSKAPERWRAALSPVQPTTAAPVR